MSKKLSPQEQEESFMAIHGDRYIYDWDSYVNNREKIGILCHSHGWFYQTPANHKKGKGCGKCGHVKRVESRVLPFNEFVLDCLKTHGNKYNYFEESYVNLQTKIKIECKIHGVFYQYADSHRGGSGCPICKNIKMSELMVIPFEDAVKDFRKIHGDKYNYFEDTYINSQKKIKIECRIHGIFEQTPSNHKNSKGCPKCRRTSTSKLITKSFEDVIDGCRKIHGDKYNYFKGTYINSQKKMEIECKIHGIFNQSPNGHKAGRGCPKCANIKSKDLKTLSFDETISSFKKIHGDKYKYSRESYIDSIKKIVIICPLHGEFKQSPSAHKRGAGCPKCGAIKISESRTIPFDKFIQECFEVHGEKYNYSKDNYVNTITKMKIECPKHGFFYQVPSQHKSGAGCPKCKNETISKLRTLKFENLLKDFQRVHGDKYNYFEESYIEGKVKMKMECKTHGFFYQWPESHKRGCGCPSCASSRGEESIFNYLSSNNFEFERQKTFKGCSFERRLRFDFYIHSINTCIEYDGEQHSNFCEIWHKDQDGFEFQKQKDEIKNKYCQENNIRLIRISYLDFENIDNILSSSLI